MPALHAHKSDAHPSLRAMLADAYRADPLDELICAVSDTNYSTRFHLIPAAMAVLRVAAEIEPEPAEVLYWYRSTGIEQFGQLTPEKLVAMGRAEEVVSFLRAIRDQTVG
jgi:hypothetical protein